MKQRTEDEKKEEGKRPTPEKQSAAKRARDWHFDDRDPQSGGILKQIKDFDFYHE
jgi:hypothetical protein